MIPEIEIIQDIIKALELDSWNNFFLKYESSRVYIPKQSSAYRKTRNKNIRQDAKKQLMSGQRVTTI